MKKNPMSRYKGLDRPFKPDWKAWIDTIRRKGTPRRVHQIEFWHDIEIVDAIVGRFDLARGIDASDPDFSRKRLIALQRFLGFDFVNVALLGVDCELSYISVEDKARKDGKRSYIEEHAGPITSWEEFEKYPWPDVSKPSAVADLEWFQENLPEGMCIIGHTGQFAEYLCWLMGYETLCLALYDQRDLVEAIAAKLKEYNQAAMRRILQFDRVKAVCAGDDMGFRGGLMFSPADMRRYVLGGHKMLAQMAHDAGRVYLLHSCGKLADIMPDLIDDVKVDGKHSFEDTIEDCRDAKNTWGRRMAILGGIDVDFLCRGDEAPIRVRVRDTLDKCLPGGGYCLGTGNSVANYIPVENYLAMIDEGRLY